jgi:Arc/MetJ-type ribon-helix-helix transcriptional regulator
LEWLGLRYLLGLPTLRAIRSEIKISLLRERRAIFMKILQMNVNMTHPIPKNRKMGKVFMVLPIVIPLVKHMPTRKVAVSIDSSLLDEVDRLVFQNEFPNRSKAIQQALKEKLDRIKHVRLARESEKLIIGEEQAIAEEGIGDPWSEY